MADTNEDTTFAEHAEIWWEEQGEPLPERDTPAWRRMYELWHAFAFRDF